MAIVYVQNESLEAGKKKQIHINQHNIKSNKHTIEKKAVITIKSGDTNTYCNEVLINGPSRVRYMPDKPLSCGAKVWVETRSAVELVK